MQCERTALGHFTCNQKAFLLFACHLTPSTLSFAHVISGEKESRRPGFCVLCETKSKSILTYVTHVTQLCDVHDVTKIVLTQNHDLFLET